MLKHRHAVPVLPERVVVLGSRGFVGAELVRHLREVGIPPVPLSSAEIDLLRPESVEGLQRIVHKDDTFVITSAITPDRGKDPATLMKNLTMGAHLSTFLERSACSHVVYISSDAVYKEGLHPISEISCCDPSTFHGLMHLTRERMLAHSVRASGTPLLILRPSLLYGARDTHNAYGPNRFVRSAVSEGTITLFGNGEETRDHVCVQDLCRLVGLCMGHRSEGVLNAATGTSTSFLDVAQLVAGFSPRAVRTEHLPRAAPVTHRHFDNAVTLRSFPAFRYTPLQTGLREVFRALLVTAERGEDARGNA